MANKSKYSKKVDDVEIDPIGISLDDYIQQKVSIKQMPEMYGEFALDFYKNLFEGRQKGEGKTMKSSTRNENKFLQWLYGDRLAYLIGKYQNEPQRFREYIVRCRESGIYWSGDDVDFFKVVVTEILTYRKMNPDEKKKYKFGVLSHIASGRKHENRLNAA